MHQFSLSRIYLTCKYGYMKIGVKSRDLILNSESTISSDGSILFFIFFHFHRIVIAKILINYSIAQ